MPNHKTEKDNVGKPQEERDGGATEAKDESILGQGVARTGEADSDSPPQGRMSRGGVEAGRQP